MAELSGFEVLALLKEIDAALRGAYINNIYSSGDSQLIRLRKQSSEDTWLVVSPKKGVWISKLVSERGETSGFTSALRAELERGRYVAASQFDLDRVFDLKFEGREGRRLIVEMMPPGNLTVADQDGKALLVQTEVRTPTRRLVQGGRYAPPRQSRLSPGQVSPKAVGEMAAQESTVGRAIGRHIALPRKYVAECLARLGLKEGDPSSELQGREAEVVEALAQLVREVRDDPRPCICATQKGDDIFAIPPAGAKVTATAPTLSELCDRLFLLEAQTEVVPPSDEETKRKELEATVDRLRTESGAYLAQAAKLREVASAARSAPLSEAIEMMRSAGVKPDSEPGSSAAVASAVFDRAKELESRSVAALDSARKLERRVSKVGERSPAKAKPIPKKRQEWYEKFRWFFTTEGKLAIGGRDAQTNGRLLSAHLEPRDTVYHADLFGSPFFVLKGGENQSEAEVSQVSAATVAFSSAWKTGLGSADAYWVRPEQVSSAAPSGEYLARGSFAIRGKKNFVNKVLVEVAVGIDQEGRMVVGPEEAIRSRSPRYLVLRPQREKSSDTAKRVVKELASFYDKPLPGSALDEALRMLPAGGGKLIRRGGPSI
ncbi:MAG TPA: NFACT family protein [Nitrososphaerales archaeon]|nr:NFACT family protein [Nitrososphaerales archaeon]